MKTAGRRVTAVLRREAAGGRVVTLSTTDLMMLTGTSRPSVEYGLAQARAAGAIDVSYCPETGARLIRVRNLDGGTRQAEVAPAM